MRNRITNDFFPKTKYNPYAESYHKRFLMIYVY